MNIYTAISIGPIIATLSQVQKPRNLWSASYIFSHLMKIIIDEGEKLNGKIISPAKDDLLGRSKIGLYPDRAFFEGKINIEDLTDNAFKKLHSDVNIDADKLSNYFNVMGLTIEEESESKAIRELNTKLDALELANRSENNDARAEVLKLISKRKNSPLFKLGFEDENFDIACLAYIAAKELQSKSEEQWGAIVSKIKMEEHKKIIAERALRNQKITEEEYWDFIDEKDFFTEISKNEILKPYFKSYHKYFCVVQADGDFMGKVIGNLQDGKLQKLSETLIAFGKTASDLIKIFGGLPIYAGGDDLLFIAPVVSKGNIFGLIKCIDCKYKEIVASKTDSLQKSNPVPTSMSYGISINYYKHPLYEVLEDARNLLFVDAKTTRNTIVCNFRKHSGSSFKVTLNRANDEIKTAFEDLIGIVQEDNFVSAVAHKLHQNNELWYSTGGDKKRLEAFFKKIMELGEDNKIKQDEYLTKVNTILELLLKNRETLFSEIIKNRMEKDKVKDKIKYERDIITETIYSMLRVAKFINGEEVKDE